MNLLSYVRSPNGIKLHHTFKKSGEPLSCVLISARIIGMFLLILVYGCI